MSCTVKIELGFLNIYDEIWIVCDSFSMFLVFQTIFHFQGSHMLAFLVIYKYMATLKMKPDPILLLRKLKNP